MAQVRGLGPELEGVYPYVTNEMVVTADELAKPIGDRLRVRHIGGAAYRVENLDNPKTEGPYRVEYEDRADEGEADRARCWCKANQYLRFCKHIRGVGQLVEMQRAARRGQLTVGGSPRKRGGGRGKRKQA